MDGPAAMGSAGPWRGFTAQHDHRRAGLFRGQYQPAAGSQVIAGQGAPRFQNHGGQIRASRRIESGLQQGAFVRGLDDQQPGGVNAQASQTLSIKLSPHSCHSGPANQHDRLFAAAIRRGEGKRHGGGQDIGWGMHFVQLPGLKPQEFRLRRREKCLRAGWGLKQEH